MMYNGVDLSRLLTGTERRMIAALRAEVTTGPPRRRLRCSEAVDDMLHHVIQRAGVLPVAPSVDIDAVLFKGIAFKADPLASWIVWA